MPNTRPRNTSTDTSTEPSTHTFDASTASTNAHSAGSQQSTSTFAGSSSQGATKSTFGGQSSQGDKSTFGGQGSQSTYGAQGAQATQSSESGSNYDASGATAAALGAFATHSIQQGIQNLHIDPQLLEIGQQAVAASMNLVSPVRKAFKSNPMLVGTGLASIAVGGVLLGLALVRDNNISLRQFTTAKPKFEN